MFPVGELGALAAKGLCLSLVGVDSVHINQVFVVQDMALAVVFGYERQVFELSLGIGMLQHHETGSPAAVRQAFKPAVDDGIDDGQDYRLVDGVGSVPLAQIGLLFFRVMALIVIASHFLVVVQDYFE